MPSERAAALAADFAAANQDVVEFARSCSEAEWALVVPGEQWPVGVVVHHIAEGHEHGLQWLSRMAHGEPVTDTAEGIDQDNAAHATRAATVDRDETVALLEANAVPLERAASRWIVSADPEEQLAQIRPYVELGFTHLVFHAPGPDQSRFLRLYAEQVLPLLRAKLG